MILRRGLLVAASVVAVTGSPGDRETPAGPVNTLIAGLLAVMKAGHATPFQQRYATLALVIGATFDLPEILRASVGLTWAEFPPAEQAALVEAFRRFTVSSYVNNFDRDDGLRFQVDPLTRAAGADVIVDTKIIPATGDVHVLSYVMRQSGGGGWRVVDVLAEGSISRVAVQRSDFRRLLAQGGPEALAQSLRTKAADLSEGMG
jgi:phospholipid transport system substrate-binding protein